jgi:hypothetical protein
VSDLTLDKLILTTVRFAVDPFQRVQGCRIKLGQEGKKLAIRFWHQNAPRVATCRSDVIGAEDLDEGLDRHGFTGLMAGARRMSCASGLETGTVSLARSLFQAERSIITSATVSL